MGPLDADLEDLYRRRHGAYQVMLASVTGGVDSARDVVQEAFARALQYQHGYESSGHRDPASSTATSSSRGRK